MTDQKKDTRLQPVVLDEQVLDQVSGGPTAVETVASLGLNQLNGLMLNPATSFTRIG